MIFNENGEYIKKKDIENLVVMKYFNDINDNITKQERIGYIIKMSNISKSDAETVDSIIRYIYKSINGNIHQYVNSINKKYKKIIGQFSVSRCNPDYDKYNGVKFPSIPLVFINDSIFIKNKSEYDKMTQEFINLINNDCERQKYVSCELSHDKDRTLILLNFDIVSIVDNLVK